MASVIETGVDKLVSLIRQKKKISVIDAAKELGVGSVVVEEWADFLEQEGLINIEYKFATPYLTEKKITDEEVKDKENEFHSKKEGFIRKAEVTLAILDKEGETFQKFKEHFENLKKDLGTDLEKVQNELKELEKYENLKKNIDHQLQEQEKEFQENIQSFEREMQREQQKYKDVIDNITVEEERLDKEKLEALSLREKEIAIKNRLEEFNDNIAKINQALREGDSSISNSEKRIRYLKNLAEDIKKEIQKKKDKGETLFKKSEDHQKKIHEIQKDVFSKLSANKDLISAQVEEGKDKTRKFKEFFDKKIEIEQLIKDMDKEKDDLEHELIDLIKKAKAFHLSSKSNQLKGHVKELEKKFEEIKKKKTKFEEEAQRISSLLKQ